MASNDQAFKAGELKGQTQEKAAQMMAGAKDMAEGAKKKGFETAQAAKDKVSEVTQATNDKTSDATPVEISQREAPVERKGVFEATADGVTGAAAGAADAIKRTLGMGDSTKKT